MNNIKEIAKIVVFMLLAVAGFYACKEGERFGISSDDTVPPAPPELDSVQPLPGGAKIFYKIPADKDVISIEASFTATNDKVIKSAVSFFAPHLEIFGLPDTLVHTLQLYALDRAGNQSEVVYVPVKPLEPTYSRVNNTLDVYPAFSSMMVSWKNELEQDVNILVDIAYSDNGTKRTIHEAFSSNKLSEQRFINNLNIPVSEPVSVQVIVEDLYGNRTKSIEKGPMHLMADELISKRDWYMPDRGTFIGSVGMSNGDNWEAKNSKVIDGIINDEQHPGNYGAYNVRYPATGTDLNQPSFNLFIDLGAKYELSRIITHQRRFWDPGSLLTQPRGDLYRAKNVGTYKMYYWDGDDEDPVNDASGQWVDISEVTIPTPPLSTTNLEFIRMGVLGDESLMYPDSAHFTPATRWFRYQAVARFPTANWDNTAEYACNISEITLFGRKAQ
ncbi:hypothetical protein FACS189430_05530 [Bacteroidia bacterium]|nr:hypothetical protein FACS189430_05530 [Bacteroidia bacterium]